MPARHPHSYLSSHPLSRRKLSSTMYVYWKTPRTFYTRKDRHSGVSMATSESGKSHPIRISPPSVPQLAKSSPVKQRHCSDDDDISNQCGSHPPTQNPNAFETRNGEVTTIVRYPPSDSPSSEIRYSITVVEISEDCLNDSVREERQPTPRTCPAVQGIMFRRLSNFWLTELKNSVNDFSVEIGL